MNSDQPSSNLSIHSLKEVLDRRTFPGGNPIFLEGDQGLVAYILLKGDVSIYGGLGTPNKRKLVDISVGQMFGELALMANEKRTASAYTAEGCELLTITKKKLEEKLTNIDPFARYWIEYLSKRVIDLTTTKDFG